MPGGPGSITLRASGKSWYTYHLVVYQTWCSWIVDKSLIVATLDFR